MLGAWALDIKYLGYDTNPHLQDGYDGLMALLNKNDSLRMLWASSLTSDFSDIDYDLVLTSPPYINLEIYPGMTPFEGKEQFYKKFLIPLIDKCRKHIKAGGKVCFNISPAMYKDLTEVFKYEKASETVPLLQQKTQGKDKGDLIYVW
jgi:DNA modification methylase